MSAKKSEVVIFDIETAGYSKEMQLAMFDPKIVTDARLKNPAKIELDRQEKEEAWLEGAALRAERARILVIGLLYQTATGDFTPIFLDGEERDMIVEFWKLFVKQPPSTRLIGHNIKGFDIPFIVRRSYVLGIPVPYGVFNGRYLSSCFVDTMEIWAATEWGSKISLDNLARALGVGRKDGNGKDFAKLYAEDRDAALKYCGNDLLLTYGAAVKMGITL